MRKPFVAGNWKMNTDSSSCIKLAEGIASGVTETPGDKVTMAVFPPFIYLQSVIKRSFYRRDKYFDVKGYWLYLLPLRPFGTQACDW